LQLIGPCGLDLPVIYRVTCDRELFQTAYSSPVIIADHCALAPEYPHNIRQIPLLQERDRYREDIRQDEKQGRLFESEYGFTLHIIDHQIHGPV